MSADMRPPTWRESINPFGIEGPKLPLLVLSLSALLGGWSSAALGLAAPEIQATFGVSVAALTMIAAIQSSVVLILGLPLGYLVDRVNRVRLVQIANFLSPVGDMVSAAAPGYGRFLAGQTVNTLAGTPAAGADMPLLTDWYPTRSRARVFGFLSVAGTFGGLISTPIVGWLIQAYGWRSATLVLAIMGFAVAFLTLFLREPARGRIDRLELTGSTERMEDEPPPPSFTEALRGAWSIKTLRLQAIGGFVGTFAAPLNILLGLILASRFALGPFERGLLATGTSIVAIPAVMLGASVADHLLAKKPSSIVALQAAMGMVVAALMVAQSFAPTLLIFVLLSMLATVIPMVLGPIGFTVTAMVVPARYRGVGMQVFTPFALVGTLLGPLMLRVAGQIDLQQAFLLFAPFMVLSSLIILASAGSVTGDIRAARAAAVAERDAAELPDQESARILVVRDLESTIDGAVVLASVDLDVRRGEIVALTGTNGAGKSTLLKAICGLHPSTNGAVFFGGVDVTHRPTYQLVAKGMVYVPGGQGTFPDLTVADHLTLAASRVRPDELVADAAAIDVETVLDHFPALRERLLTRAGDLSGGEQQMVALAQGFVLRPDLLLIDELSLGLAPAVVDHLIAAVRELNRQGTSIVVVEQSLNIAMRVADRVVYMDQGAVTFAGTPDEMRARPDLVQAQFLGRAATARLRSRTRASVADADSPVLRGESITVDFGGVRALDNVSLEVCAGEIISLIGSNGAGKTTLFDVLSGYQPTTSGRILLDGKDVTGLSPDARARLGLARAFQSARLFGPLTVRETLAVALEKRASKHLLGAALWLPTHRRAEHRLAERIDSLIDVFGLGDKLDMPINELSTGTRRAVEVACQLAMEPRVLLLDEPAAGLAQAEVENLGPALRRIVRDTGCGIVLVEHDLPLIRSVSNRLVALDRGQVVAAGDPDDVLAHPRVLAGYLDASDDVLSRSGNAPSVPTPGEDRR